MFPREFKSRVRFCRGIFLLGCLLPTLGILWAGTARQTTGHLNSFRNMLATETGLQVMLSGVSHPRPGVLLLEGLSLSEPESREQLLSARLLEVDFRGAGILVVASQPEIQAAGWPRLWQRLEHWLRQADGSQSRCRFYTQELTLRVGDEDSPAGATSHTLTKLDASLDAAEESPRSWARFFVAGVEAENPVVVKVVRNRQISPPVTRCELNTGGSPLPCSLLAQMLPAFGPTGDDSTFRGYLWAAHDSDGWRGELTGWLDRVDLHGLVTERFPHRLSGQGSVQVQSAVVSRGQLRAASGTLHSAAGTISRSLLLSAAEGLQTPIGTDLPARNDELFEYGQLALQFTLDDRGVQIAGLCGPAAPKGALLLDPAGRPLLYEPVGRQTVAGLLRMLVPQQETLVPAAAEVQQLIGVLPVEPLRRPAEIRSADRALRVRAVRGLDDAPATE